MDENTSLGFISTFGYNPDGFRVTVSLNLMNAEYAQWDIEEAFRELDTLVTVGNLTVNPPGIEAGENVIVTSYIVRREKEDGTTIIGFYDADRRKQYKQWHHYFNQNEYGKAEATAFKEAAGLDKSFADIPLWPGDTFPAPSKLTGNNAKYLVGLPHPVRIIRKDSGTRGTMDGREYVKWWWDRCERETNNVHHPIDSPADKPERAWTMTWLIPLVKDWPEFKGIGQHAANAINKLRKEGAITDDMLETKALAVMERKYMVTDEEQSEGYTGETSNPLDDSDDIPF